MKLLHGDCLELMQDIESGSIDMILCDPPYGINYQSQRKKNKSDRLPKIKNDKEPFVDFIDDIPRVLKTSGCVLIFTRWDVQQKVVDRMTSCGMRPKNILIWDKVAHGMGDLKRAFGSRYESIVFYSGSDFRFSGKRPVDICRFKRVPSSALVHPNEKPVELLEYLISVCTKRDETVLDYTMGCGSTGVACVNTGRDFIGIELDEGYFKIAKNRIEAAKSERIAQ